MSYEFPIDPNSRKAIVVLSEYDIERCDYTPESATLLLDPETYVLPYDLFKSGSGPIALQNIKDSNLLSAGKMLVQSPYDTDVYEDASNAPEKFALEKHLIFSRLCQLLGAKSFTVQQMEIQNKSANTSAKLNAGKDGFGDGELGMESEATNQLVSGLKLTDEFTGGIADIKAAEDLLRQHRILREPSMRTLIEMRKEGGNQIKSRKLEINLSSEAANNLKVAARLNIPSFLKISAEYGSTLKEQQEYRLTVEVNF